MSNESKSLLVSPCEGETILCARAILRSEYEDLWTAMQVIVGNGTNLS